MLHHPPEDPPAYRPLQGFCAPATARAEIWRTVVGLGLIVVLYWSALVGALHLFRRIEGDTAYLRLLLSLAQATTPQGLVLMLATFVPLALSVALVTRTLNDRPVATLFGPGAWGTMLRTGPALIALSVLLLPLSMLDPHIEKSTPFGTLIAWAPLALPLLAVQITAEELVFRGYFLQQMAARWRSRWLWMVLPSAAFGLLHFSPGTYGPMAFWPVLWAMAFGCLASDLTARTGNLGAAIGFHFANNLSALFLLGLAGELDGLSLFTVAIDPSNPAMLAPYMATDALSMLVSWLLVRLLLRV
ncbi:CPBP family intramembrane glutamic endopeptidase [Paenirhodobacter populi]|uniref:CPBP family intramembrane metalloprotease n=1 Tax=Paenirhodobacter populi TaxID=2306993 RepID=A0A443J8D1_9RHOB|nr:CPBP family intramembrane glutamic endopeptidase [Sinirhodobacter populi]RWR16765.1 CPBP family intramembrane metalloprotease [Sinirhodobacter populi]